MNNSGSESSNLEDPKSEAGQSGSKPSISPSPEVTGASIPTLNIGEWGILAGLSKEELESVSNVAEVWAKIALAVAEDRGFFK